jgi:hypothetical protein
MNQSMQPAIQHLFQVSNLEGVSREQLEKFVQEYPCFGFGHYLLSRKLRAENAEDFPTAARKTSLYFSNPFWLQWMLENAESDRRETLPVRPQERVELEAHVRPEEKVHDEEPPFVLDETDQPWPAMESPEVAVETTALQADPDVPDVPAGAAELLLESLEKAKALRESIIKINEDFQSHNGLAELPIRDEEAPFVLDDPEQATPVPEPADIESTNASEPAYSEPAPVAPAGEPAYVASEPTPTGAEPAAVVAEPTLLFEPLHTIDYFASQGIRLTLDENPTDPLGRQLKSFTEWLRTMRRLPQKDREIVPDRVAEQTIQNFAAHSIEGKEPVTETMAEVLAKQGMPERARVVYEKLSLLNPEKSAYFATKIEQLNIH